MNINTLTEQYKTMEELKIFCASQFRQILQLSKKNKELEDKVTDLQKKSKENNKLSVVAPIAPLTTGESGPQLLVQDDAKTVAQIQIRMIKEQAFDRELTMEETKKLEIFNKILITHIEESPKTFKTDAKTLKQEDLLSLIEDKSESS